MNTKRFTLFAYLFTVTVLMLGLSACDRVSQIVQPPTPQMTEVGEDISIGVVLPLTGRFSYASGSPLLQSFELARSEINAAHPNGAKLKLIVEDGQGTTEGTVAAFNKLIHQDRVSVILGPTTSTHTKEVFPIAQENQVVAISPTSAARGLSAIGDFVFRVALTTDILIPRGIEVTQTHLGYQRVATLYDDTDLFSTDGDAAVREVLKARGIEVVATETFQGGDTDFSEQLTRIQALDPDVIFVSSQPPEKPGILIQGHTLGISAPFIVRTLTADNVRVAGVAAEGAMTFIGWGAAVNTPGNQAFVENYTTQFGMAPNNYAARAYAAFYILAEAIERAHSTDAAAIRDALASIRDFDTILGKFSFDANGDAVYDPKILVVKDGELVLFE
ncbi:MAG: ABC transporter substrate-binding protein [Candidatus Poribacteria bacterium]|nr:ABC transporter substrate-binding protein [Candidatus Poribacteria bacterium]